MNHPTSAMSANADIDQRDIGPLVWVLDELRKSLDGATKALRRFVRDAELAQGDEIAELDTSQLRIAKQQLHQATGALEMVGQSSLSKLVISMEMLTQRAIQRPELCSHEVASSMEKAAFAVIEYLDSLLKGKNISPVALFPQWFALLEQLGDATKAHPADLWNKDYSWQEVVLPQDTPTVKYGNKARSKLEQSVLRCIRGEDQQAAQDISRLALGFTQQPELAFDAKSYWTIAAAYFEGLAAGALPWDVYTKRITSKLLQHYTNLALHNEPVSTKMAHNLLFGCAHASDNHGHQAPILEAVRLAYGLAQTKPVDYSKAQFGRFDPSLLVQLRKRITTAAETWSALSGGDTQRLKSVAEQFSAVSDLLNKLHPENAQIAQALHQVIDTVVQSGSVPSAALGMEVATTILYLEAAYDDLDPTDHESFSKRSELLAQRLKHVQSGGEPPPLEGWMEELYRRVSDKQTIGSVVDELRLSLGEIEKSLDAYFRNPADKEPLRQVPTQVAQMRGIFSVLGLDQAATAAVKIRDAVESFLLSNEVPAGKSSTDIERVGSSVGAMGFLIDMLSYQRALAKKLFIFDEDAGVLRPIMGRHTEPLTNAPASTETDLPVSDDGLAEDLAALQALTGSAPLAAMSAAVPLAVDIPPPVSAATAPAPSTTPADEPDQELLDIFLDEAKEVIQNGRAALEALQADNTNLADQTTVRRAFHTLKGSSRMVGLHDFGEAAWAFEQLLNLSLSEHKPASHELISLSEDAMAAFQRWVEAIANGDAHAWMSQPFRASADAMRLHSKLERLQTPNTADVPVHLNTELLPIEPRAEQAPQPSEALLPELALDFDYPAIDPVTTPTPDAPDTMSAPLADVPPVEPVASPVSDTKTIGPLTLSTALFNVYLNEADEWSTRLLSLLHTWRDDLQSEIPEDAIAIAHSLQGSSGTVGFKSLSELARALENALEHLHKHKVSKLEHAEIAIRAADDIRQLLHQFAAGILKDCDQAILAALKELIELDFTVTLNAPDVPADVTTDFGHALHSHDFASTDVVDISPSAYEPTRHQELEETIELPELAMLSVDATPAEAAPVEPLTPSPQILAAPAIVIGIDDSKEIDADDHLDADLLEIFREEAVDLMPALGTALRTWVEHPDQLQQRAEVLRLLHTLKGSARLAGAMRLGEMAHRMESAIESIGQEGLQTVQLEPLLARLDQMQEAMEHLGQIDDSNVTREGFSPSPIDLPSVHVDTPTPAPIAATSALTPSVTKPASAPAAKPAPKAVVPRTGSQPTVRVRSQLLDRLLNQTGEVLIARSRVDEQVTQMRSSLTDLTSNLERLRQQLKDVELHAELQMQSRLALSKDSGQAFDPLEFDRFTRVQELTRMMAESVNDVATVQRNLQSSIDAAEDSLVAQARQTRDLQKDLLRTRMVEFDQISDRLYSVVRQASKETGKQVRLEILGANIEVDRAILDRMSGAFEHLLRNSVVHGIESSDIRTAQGKPVSGSIVIQVTQESNEVAVQFKDDGAGLNIAGIQAKAIAKGLIPAGSQITTEQAAELIFEAGFSTAEQVTELAGRGVGMDVVRAEVQAIGGRIETRTEPQQGTEFKLIIPLTTAVTHVVVLRMGDFIIGVPVNHLEVVQRVSSEVLANAYANHQYGYGNESIPFFWAGALLQHSHHSTEHFAKTYSVLIMRSAGQRVALHVDEVLGNREVVVKNLGPQLSTLPGLSGMSLLPSGAVVLIYNPVALATVYGAGILANAQRAPVDATAADDTTTETPIVKAAAAEPEVPLILVVDDSITVRRVTERLLRREGYRVALANDGLHAMDVLQDEKPAVVLSDIEMPRMDGFDLVRNIRADARLQDLPVIMITSRIAEKHREHAKALGVNHYLGKPYAEDQLLALIAGYCQQAVTTA